MSATAKVHVQESGSSGARRVFEELDAIDLPNPWRRLLGGSSRVACERLGASLANLRIEIALHLADDPALCDSACYKATQKQIDIVAEHFRRGQIDAAWRCFNLAARLSIGIENERELRARATALQHEAGADKLSGWRSKAIRDLLPSETQDKTAIDDVRARLTEATRHRDESANNTYYKVALVRSQRTIVTGALLVCVALVVGVTMVGDWVSDVEDPSIDLVALVTLFGALGGCLSAIQNLGKPRGPIPEHVASSAITITRPVIGAAAALGIYVIAASGALHIDFTETGAHLTLLSMAFAAGFSERFVIQAVGAAAGVRDQDAKPPRE